MEYRCYDSAGIVAHEEIPLQEGLKGRFRRDHSRCSNFIPDIVYRRLDMSLAKVVDGFPLRGLKKRMGIALADCCLIATAEEVDATPLSKKVEDGMKPVLS